MAIGITNNHLKILIPGKEALDQAVAETKSKSAVAGPQEVTLAEPVVIRYCEQRGIALIRPEIRAEVVQ